MNTINYDDAFQGGDMTPIGGGAAATVGAAFVNRERAHDAVHRLHDEGFSDSWIGVTRSDEVVDYRAAESASEQTRVESDNWFMRFFGEGEESLYDALVRHGVSEADARAVGELPDKSAVLTVDGSNHPELAAQILAQGGGQLITRAFAAPSYASPAVSAVAAQVSQAPAARSTSLAEDGVGNEGTMYDAAMNRERDRIPTAGRPEEALPDATAYDDYGRFRAGTPVDESTRLQLRAERLRVDKSRISGDDATLGNPVTDAPAVSGPLIREDVFTERRPGRP
jgi:hypothetical protein